MKKNHIRNNVRKKILFRNYNFQRRFHNHIISLNHFLETKISLTLYVKSLYFIRVVYNKNNLYILFVDLAVCRKIDLDPISTRLTGGTPADKNAFPYTVG